MSFGLAINNMNGGLVVSESAPIYRYAGSATLESTYTNPYRFYIPTVYKFKWTAPNTSVKAIPFIRLSSSITLLPGYFYQSGLDWIFEISGVANSNENTNVQPPGIDIFILGAAAGDSAAWGLDLFNGSGVKHFAFHDKPLVFAANSVHYGTTSFSDSAADAASLSAPVTTPSMLWTDVGGFYAYSPGAFLTEREYGWSLSADGTQVLRRPITIARDSEHEGYIADNEKYSTTNFFVDMARY